MTTKITITHSGPNHHAARVRIMSGGVEQRREVLLEGESTELYVHSGQQIEVQEGPAIESKAVEAEYEASKGDTMPDPAAEAATEGVTVEASAGVHTSAEAEVAGQQEVSDSDDQVRTDVR